MIAENYTKPYNNLKGHMARKGYNQKDLAEAADISSTALSFKINRRDGRDFTLEEAKRISKLLDIKVDDFF
ncbi:MAG: helix-turn-helix transcriptional regulator [Tetragenococcus halophilus]|nr:helix-turn-helix transcriptional regulator [Tetragenococcus halophilus]